MKRTQAIFSVFILLSLALFALSCHKKPSEPDIEPKTVATPTFSPSGGTYSSGQVVTLDCATSGAMIFYTTDGSEPTEISMLYSSPIDISRDTTLKARAFKDGSNPSVIATAIYTIIIMPPDQMIYVPGGTFHNGSSNITVSGFHISKYEITQAEYQAVMGENPSQYAGNPNHPVERVTWFDAIAFCNHRSIMEGFEPCYTYLGYGTNPYNWPYEWDGNMANQDHISCNWEANGYRLPSEMEWMYAAMGGIQTNGYTYAGSDDLDEVGWHDGNSAGGTKPVGSKAPNELGLYDMTGNVQEWCWDRKGDYPTQDVTDFHGDNVITHRVHRGGSWLSNPSACTITHRGSYYPTHSYFHTGFRVGMSFP